VEDFQKLAQFRLAPRLQMVTTRAKLIGFFDIGWVFGTAQNHFGNYVPIFISFDMFEHRKPTPCGHVQIGHYKSGVAVRLPVRKLPLAHEVGNRFGAAVSELKRVLDAYRTKRLANKNLVRLVVLNYQDSFVISHSLFLSPARLCIFRSKPTVGKGKRPSRP
jgi:hypothetical protein